MYVYNLSSYMYGKQVQTIQQQLPLIKQSNKRLNANLYRLVNEKEAKEALLLGAKKYGNGNDNIWLSQKIDYLNFEILKINKILKNRKNHDKNSNKSK